MTKQKVIDQLSYDYLISALKRDRVDFVNRQNTEDFDTIIDDVFEMASVYRQKLKTKINQLDW